MGKKKKQEKQKKKLSSEEKALLKEKKKAEKAAKEPKAEKPEKAAKEPKAEKPEKAAKEPKTEKVIAEPEKAAAKMQPDIDLTEHVQISADVPVIQKVPKVKQQDDSVLSVKEATLVFRALGDESRMEILSLLEEQEMCALELLQCVSIVQSTLSHHMKVLTESGLVNCRRDNKRIYYSINLEQMKKAAEFLKHYHQS